MQSDTAKEKARALRYKKAAMQQLSIYGITERLQEMSEACSDVRYFFGGDDDNLVDALDGDEEEAFEFKMAFSMLDDMCCRLYDAIQEAQDYGDANFDDFMVSIIGNRYNVVGFDGYEEDYYALSRFEAELAQTESGKRIMRMKKEDILSTAGQCLGIAIAFLDVQARYDALESAIDVLRGTNRSLLEALKNVERAYDEASADDFRPYMESYRKFDQTVNAIPDQFWIE